MPATQIQYYSDLLCVWAYIGQLRVDEVRSVFGERVSIDYHFVDVFGDIPGRLTERWKDKGGLAAYAKHVSEVAARFDHVEVTPEVWTRNTPRSSASCHEFLHAVQLAAGKQALERAAGELRKAFFVRAEDVGLRRTQFALAEQLDIPRAEVERYLETGDAMTRLSRDTRTAAEQGIRISPTLVFDGGRQVLKGNVGYRVIEANIQELLAKGSAEHSWC